MNCDCLAQTAIWSSVAKENSNFTWMNSTVSWDAAWKLAVNILDQFQLVSQRSGRKEQRTVLTSLSFTILSSCWPPGTVIPDSNSEKIVVSSVECLKGNVVADNGECSPEIPKVSCILRGLQRLGEVSEDLSMMLKFLLSNQVFGWRSSAVESGKVPSSSLTSSNISESQSNIAPLAKVPLFWRSDQGQQEYTGEEQLRVRAYTPLPPGAPGPRSLEGNQSGEDFGRGDCR